MYNGNIKHQRKKDDSMKKCVKCNKNFEDELKFCETCGSKLEEVKESEKFEEGFLSEDLLEKKDLNDSVETEEMKCSKCGHKLESGNVFCENCGQAIGITESTTNNSPQCTTLQENNTEKIRKVPTKKQKFIFSSVVILICFIIVGYFFGKNYFTREHQIERFVNVLVEKKPEKLAKKLTSTDPNYKVTKENLEVFTKYLDTHKKYTSNLATALKTGAYDNGDIFMAENGRYFLLFPKYEFYIKPVYITMGTNEKNVEFLVNGESMGTSDSETFKKEIGPLTPGTYVFEGKLSEGKQVEVNKTEMDLIRFENDEFNEEQYVNLTINKVKFDVVSNVSSGDVYVDNKKVGSLKDGELSVDSLIWHQGMTVQVKQTFDDGEVVSNIYTIAEGEYLEDGYNEYSSITLYVDDVIETYNIESFLSTFYSNVTNYTDNYYDFGEPEENILATYFIKGKENKEYIDFADNFIRQIRSSENKEYISCYPTFEKVKRIGMNTYEIQYTITYTTNYTNKPALTEKFRYKKATFKVEDGELKIDNLGGTENFEIIQQ
ncbi:MAG: zinc-ribbon domain-containing protein [Clostridium sulfidigenes]|uniref:Zinc-ribbon domain-containing protein n=1 Tax=Clostridium sulfidigenes TaxID=318464 RepID=A0A927ZSS8_9CLOT|nr:zinc-ribbon domain-containing protein [Clostridium sulfidigenes]